MLRRTLPLLAATLLLGAAAPASGAACTEADPCYAWCDRLYERCQLMGGTDCDEQYNYCIEYNCS